MTVTADGDRAVGRDGWAATARVTAAYKLDGTETEVTRWARRTGARSRAKWDGSKLVITDEDRAGRVRRRPGRWRSGKLIVDRTGRPRPVVDDLQEDHLASASSFQLTAVQLKEGPELTLRPFLVSQLSTSLRQWQERLDSSGQ
mgnify:CR=1 FL=1